MHYNYSIIVPHKNTLDLLRRCLDSIPRRADIQTIVVDDNSDNIDKSRFPGVDDANVAVIFTKESKGAGFARNVGLTKAKGKWILFADADDYFLPDCFENVIDKYINSSVDIVYFGAISIYSDTGETAMRHLNIMKHVKNYCNNTMDVKDRLKYSVVNPICKLISHKLIQKHYIRFDEVMYSNDVMFSIYSGHYAKYVLAEPIPIYCITVFRGSLMNKQTKNSIKSRFTVNLRRNMFLRSIGKNDYQVSVMNHLLFSFKKGPLFFSKFIKLMVKYKANPFVGYTRWINTLFKIFKDKKNKRKYIVYE